MLAVASRSETPLISSWILSQSMSFPAHYKLLYYLQANFFLDFKAELTKVATKNPSQGKSSKQTYNARY